MQEPLLFNTTIKENILYGNDKADDAKVRQVAQMANALQFIESNIEDLEADDINNRIEKKFIDITQKEMHKYPNIGNLSKIYKENTWQTNYEEMRLIEELIAQSDHVLKATINSNTDLFIATIQKYSSVKGIRWDDIVHKFEYVAS